MIYEEEIVTAEMRLVGAFFQGEIAEGERHPTSLGCSDGPHTRTTMRISIRIARALDRSAGSVQVPTAACSIQIVSDSFRLTMIKSQSINLYVE